MKKRQKNKAPQAAEQNKIARGSTFVGDIESQGCFRIEGTLKGSLKTGGKVVLSKSGVIEGELKCAHADFEGRFNGTLNVENDLTLRSTATLDGEVTTGKLTVEPGAKLNGSCDMKGSLKNIKDNNGQRQKQSEKSA